MSREIKKRPRLCPCGRVTASGKRARYKKCCGALHKGLAPPSPEALMRSRFTAFALGLTDYLLSSVHRTGPLWRDDTDPWRAELDDYCRQTSFRNLEITHTAESDDDGFAEVAYQYEMETAGRSAVQTAHSRFKKQDGRWAWYDDVD